MSNYVKATDFASKDALLSGNPAKVIKGTEIDDEFNAIATAVSTKADSVSPTLTGTPVAPTAAGGTNSTQIATTAFVNSAITSERTASVTLTNKTLTSPTISSPTLTSVTITSGSITGITDLAVADGGTGASSFTANNVLLGNGTSAFQTVAPGTSGNVLKSDGTTWTSAALTTLTAATAQNTTSGTTKDFTGIPSWVKRITIVFNGVGNDSSSNLLIQLGDSGGFETSGYLAMSSFGTSETAFTTGFGIINGTGTTSGIMTLVNVSGNIWVSSHSCSRYSTTSSAVGGGTKTLSDVLTQIRITLSGSGAFDEGSVNILYE